jgi:uncharacterized membrane protein
MSEQHPAPAPRQSGWFDPGPQNIQAIYILYLVGFVVGITALVGLVMAYLNRGKSEPWVETHYTWAIRTFWIALLGAFISAILMIVAIGVILMFAVAVWVVVRVVIGLQAVSKGEPIKNPQSWML